MHYIPNHLYVIYKDFYSKLPIAESVWTKLVTLPLFPDLTDAEVDQVIDGVRTFKPSKEAARTVAMPGLTKSSA
jgi:perosamine synthetase